MSNIQNATSATSKTFVTALVFNAAVFAIEITAFTILRPYFKAIYEPRTYIPPQEKRAKPLSSNPISWPIALFKSDYREIIKANGMDAYFFVRYLRMMIILFLPIWLISWAVLLPVTAVNSNVDGRDGLDKLSFGNIANTKQTRYAAHLILVWLFTFWVYYNIKQEMRHFVITRQKHLIDPEHAKTVQANTILITGIPAKFLTQDALHKLYNHLPGGVKKIWINRNLKELPDLYDRRMAACNKLESAETALLNTAAKLRLKAQKSAAKGKDPAAEDVEQGDVRSAEVLVPKEKRPTHRLGMIPFFGEKVDSINWSRDEIAVCTQLLEEGRAKISEADERGSSHPDISDDPLNEVDDNPEVEQSTMPRLTNEASAMVHDVKGAAIGAVGAVKGRVGGLIGSGELGVYPPMNSAFVTFNKQIAAHMAAQILTHHEPYRMGAKYVEVAPTDVIWGNLGLNPYEQKIRLAVSYAATAGLILLWAFPVAFVGAVSNIYDLCERESWLAWICKLPSVVVGIISGILPPVLLAVLMMLLPIVLRLLARFEGIPQRTGLELSLMTRFFLFQVLHSFLIVTLSSGIIASLDDLLGNPTSVPTTLAQNLPKASTFFLTYIILQGLSGTAGGFLQVITLIIYYVKLFLLGSTPRSVYGIKYSAPEVAWGTLFPTITLLTVISLAYSIISPVINGLACATFFLFYMLYKYLFLWVNQQNQASDTGGLFFPKAMQHIFVGMYLQQVCLCALFFLARDENKKASAVPEGALMVVLIVLTAGYHIIINNSYGPLIHALPLSLADRTYTYTEDRVDDNPGEPRQSMEDKAKLTDQGLASPDSNDESKRLTEDDYGFSHPAASRPQRTVWIPKDALGLSDEELEKCRAAGVEVGDENAYMDEKGKVDVSGGPPDFI